VLPTASASAALALAICRCRSQIVEIRTRLLQAKPLD
jgi:hypothetical protein